MIKERWQIGAFTVTKVVELERSSENGRPGSTLPDARPDLVKEIDWLHPHFVTDEGWLKTSIHALLVETPDIRLIVDTCAGNDKDRHLPQFNRLSTTFLDSLANLGWTRESVDAVLCTHLHVDHVGWNTMLVDGEWVPTFPRARYFFAEEEYRYWLASLECEAGLDGLTAETLDLMDNRAVFLDSVKPIVDAGLVAMVETDAVVAPGVSLMPTPGHTPGHVSIVLESEGERAIITGDMMHHPCQIARPQWSSGFDSHPHISEETRQTFLSQFVDSPTLVIGTHFTSPTAGWIVRDDTGYRLKF
ncbi:MBL fold metallo-hydrolase [Novosphingobium sp.]|uniref:MBL fold metallo-hydrolase n=1 Tax=Novosphingobium sp. TaxID=1874826 RepID=UPI00260A2605|nr:MBL fold metallo-hydrolase [Novosphingobium sp.]